MLPTSHRFPINPLDDASGLDLVRQIDAITRPDNEVTPDLLAQESFGAMSLTEAFAEFITASARLEGSYGELQGEVSELKNTLAERNRALHESLRDNEQMRLSLERIVEAMPCGVLVVDSSGAILMINGESRRLLGGTTGSLTGTVANLDEIPAWRSLNLKRFYGGASEDTEQEFSVPAAGGKRWLELRNRRLGRNRLGPAPGFATDGQNNALEDHTILILRDITAQKLMEGEREAALRSVTLAEITTILAHEIRNPLASLELFAGLIATDGLTSPVWISHMRAGIRSLSGTVNNVLSFHGAGAMSLAPLDLDAVIEAGVEFARPMAEQAQVSLRWLSGGEVRILGNESALQQVTLNLIANAIRHTPAGGSITVWTEAGGGRVVVSFQDSGCGIAAELLVRIFEPGFSAGGDRPGLGLAVSKRIVEKHGGSIRALSGAHTPGSRQSAINQGRTNQGRTNQGKMNQGKTNQERTNQERTNQEKTDRSAIFQGATFELEFPLL